MRTFVLVLVAFALGVFAAKSSLVSVGSDGKLTYTKNEQGDRLMDYSSVGYKNGAALPSPSSVPNKVTLKPSGGDDTAAIQAALDKVSKLALDENGFRGAVLLSSGTFQLSKGVKISASGVVLRGSGTDAKRGTTLMCKKSDSVVIEGTSKPQVSKSKNLFVKKYIPFGDNRIALQSVEGLKKGDSIFITSTFTGKFVKLLGMDKLVRDGKNQTWIRPGTQINTDRVITAIRNNTITIDSAYPDSVRPELFDRDEDLPFVVTYKWDDRLQNSGLESLRAIHPKEQNGDRFARLNNAFNCWVRNLYIQDFMGGVVETGGTSKMITIMGLEIFYSAAYKMPAPPGILVMSGTQILHRDTNITGGGSYWPLTAVGAASRGPNVHHNININAGPGAQVVPHARWSTAMLYDNVINQKGPIAISYRNTMGSGHGWTMGWGAIWNSQAVSLCAQNPYNHFDASSPVLYHNWVVGGKGENVPGYQSRKLVGTYDSVGTPVTPDSLYLAQMKAKSI